MRLRKRIVCISMILLVGILMGTVLLTGCSAYADRESTKSNDIMESESGAKAGSPELSAYDSFWSGRIKTIWNLISSRRSRRSKTGLKRIHSQYPLLIQRSGRTCRLCTIGFKRLRTSWMLLTRKRRTSYTAIPENVSMSLRWTGAPAWAICRICLTYWMITASITRSSTRYSGIFSGVLTL